MQDKHWYLQQIDLFQGISEEEIMGIASCVDERKCQKDEVLYTQEDESDQIFVLKKGEVTLYNTHRGKKLIIDVLKPGSIFGNITFQKGKSSHVAEVTEDAYICIFPIDDFLKIVQAKPELTLKLMKVMSERISEYESRLKSGLLDAKEKILHHLEILESKNRKPGILGKIKRKKITHEKLAQHTGLSRETVTRAINDLKKEGISLPL